MHKCISHSQSKWRTYFAICFAFDLHLLFNAACPPLRLTLLHLFNTYLLLCIPLLHALLHTSGSRSLRAKINFNSSPPLPPFAQSETFKRRTYIQFAARVQFLNVMQLPRPKSRKRKLFVVRFFFVFPTRLRVSLPLSCAARYVRIPIRCRFSLRGNDATVSLLLPAELCSFRKANYFINERGWAYLGGRSVHRRATKPLAQGI